MPKHFRNRIQLLTMNSKISMCTLKIIQINRGDTSIGQCKVICTIPGPRPQQTSRFILKMYVLFISMLNVLYFLSYQFDLQ